MSLAVTRLLARQVEPRQLITMPCLDESHNLPQVPPSLLCPSPVLLLLVVLVLLLLVLVFEAVWSTWPCRRWAVPLPVVRVRRCGMREATLLPPTSPRCQWRGVPPHQCR